MLTMNALCCAEGVIVAYAVRIYFALEGLTDLVGSIRRVHAEKIQDSRLFQFCV